MQILHIKFKKIVLDCENIVKGALRGKLKKYPIRRKQNQLIHNQKDPLVWIDVGFFGGCEKLTKNTLKVEVIFSRITLPALLFVTFLPTFLSHLVGNLVKSLCSVYTIYYTTFPPQSSLKQLFPAHFLKSHRDVWCQI